MPIHVDPKHQPIAAALARARKAMALFTYAAEDFDELIDIVVEHTGAHARPLILENAGKDVHVRVRRVDNAEVTMTRTWGAHERIAMRREKTKKESGEKP